jgi:hypothetical protein
MTFSRLNFCRGSKRGEIYRHHGSEIFTAPNNVELPSVNPDLERKWYEL